MPSSFSTLQLSTRDRVLTITLDRPDSLNAFNTDMSVELSAALRTAQRDRNVRCIVLTGAGRAFCTGQDLRALQAGVGPQAGSDLGDYLRESINPVVLRLRTLEKPVIAALNGVAAGAGVSFALAADLRVWARSATLKMAFLDMGLVPDAAATLTLVQHAGYARAAELCLLGETLTADQALAIGLATRVVDDERLAAEVQEMAARLAGRPRLALGLTKRALNQAWTATLDEQLAYEANLQSTASRTADHREAVAAFLEKRPPHFSDG
jgi:2-(1,2-epoxy-1,2-dihydrophenyl)acetyl-CoA isomerase